MEHVGVRDHDVRARADRLARVLRRVAVVGEGADVGPDRLDHRVQLGQLVLGQRLRREQVERPRVGVLEDAVEDRQVVAERLARGGRRDHDHVLARPGRARRPRAGGCRGPRSPARRASLAQLRVQLLREVHEPGRLGREVPQGGEHRLAAERLLDLEALQDGQQLALAVARCRHGPGRGPGRAAGPRFSPPRRPQPVGGLHDAGRIMQERPARAGPKATGLRKNAQVDPRCARVGNQGAYQIGEV